MKNTIKIKSESHIRGAIGEVSHGSVVMVAGPESICG